MYTKSQEQALKALLNGESCFLTGKAGTGKSFILNEFCKLTKNKVVKLSSTGISASNIGGQTVHSFFSIFSPKYNQGNFVNSNKKLIFKLTDTFIIDECSMLTPNILDIIEDTLAKNTKYNLSDYQFVFCGDFKQLAPVVKELDLRLKLIADYGGLDLRSHEFFNSLPVYELGEIVRCDNEEFNLELNKIRDGVETDYFDKFVSKDIREDSIILCPYNSQAEYYNTVELNKLEGKEFTNEAEVHNCNIADFQIELNLKLKDGCKVMFLINDYGLSNGMIGTFKLIDDKPYFLYQDQLFELYKEKFIKYEYVGRKDGTLGYTEVGCCTQYPVKPAYAITIHKSQGLTLDKVTLDLTKACFADGQYYVALSRIKDPNNLTILK
jgi:hypothetical protein